MLLWPRLLFVALPGCLQADGKAESYTGPLQAVPLREFLDQYATRQPLSTDSAVSEGAVASPLDPVLHSLTADNLTDIDDKDDMWLVAFYSPTGRPHTSLFHGLDSFVIHAYHAHCERLQHTPVNDCLHDLLLVPLTYLYGTIAAVGFVHCQAAAWPE